MFINSNMQVVENPTVMSENYLYYTTEKNINAAKEEAVKYFADFDMEKCAEEMEYLTRD